MDVAENDTRTRIGVRIERNVLQKKQNRKDDRRAKEFYGWFNNGVGDFLDCTRISEDHFSLNL